MFKEKVNAWTDGRTDGRTTDNGPWHKLAGLRPVELTKLVEVHKEMPHTKSLRHPVSEKKNFEDGLFCSYVQTCDHRDRPSFDPKY